MNLKLQTFNNNQFGMLRIAEIDNKIYYCGNDVAKALGYANPQKAIRTHCKGVTEMDTPTNGGMQKLNYIPEGDVYRLTARSKLPQAEKFESWVFDEVLPQIANTGSYSLPTTPEEKLDLLLEVSHNQKEKVKLIDERVNHLENELKLDSSQYGYLSNLVSKRLATVKDVYKYEWKMAQCGILRHAINRDICEAMNARPRTQIKSKDFEKACKFVEEWNPSSPTLNKISELEDMHEE